ncbi:glutamate--tRNA ligase [Thioalkalivibrio sp. XN8]|uniref:glutamate--tRNA ligase n=1 Tax=Thioalkalivibrio sp. XN8 TaxID=2712863 RepID=UPI0013EDF628|nr:glutamate--tRNA ligase [Thioalkalivibrio sp. XN8]
MSDTPTRTVRTRFAPSPTGYLHIGGVRTALFSWLQARRHGGEFVLRIEDTDRARSTEEAIQVILDGMEWLGLRADEGPLYQTDRFDRYNEIAAQLLASGHAYHCYCTKEELDEMRAAQMARGEKPRYDGRCRDRKEPKPGVPPVLRFRNPDQGQVVVDDKVRGRVVFDNKELDDLVLLRSDGVPTYNYSVVVDDMDMGITHVVRGDDHLNNTPRQINVYHALGAEPPVFAHVPMILGPDGAKLSKRHGAVSVLQYRQEGYLPEALLNYLVRLGWSHGDQEIFSVDEMIELFDIGDVNKSASSFNPEKLLWLNQHYIKEAPPARLAAELQWQLERLGVECSRGPALEAVAEAFRERAKTMHEMAQAAIFFYQDFETYHEKAARQHLGAAAAEPLKQLMAGLEALEDWQAGPIHDIVQGVAEGLGLKMGKVAQPLRVAVSGGPVSPPIDVTVALLGKDKTLARLRHAVVVAASAGDCP